MGQLFCVNVSASWLISPASYCGNIHLPAGEIYQVANQQNSVWLPTDKYCILDICVMVGSCFEDVLFGNVYTTDHR